VPANSAGSSRTANRPSAREVRVGDRLRVTTDGGDFQVEVLLLNSLRGPASVARGLYFETEARRELRKKLSDERNSKSYPQADHQNAMAG
jgi:ribosomal 50S subunit-recycling heat shock protein